ncbi:MAG: ABC transporter ATP-binding protein [Magnetovibrio sp.]|nr:ABC transporter ATP-binding protein [Magnetovibrio sp.]
MNPLINFTVAMLKRRPWLFVINAGLGIIITVLDGLAIIAIAPIVSTLMGGNDESLITEYYNIAFAYLGFPESIEMFLILVVSLNIAKSIVQTGAQYYIFSTQYKVIREMIVEVVSSLLSSSINFMNREKQGSLANSLNQEITKVGEAFTFLSLSIAPIILIGVILAIPFSLSWETTTVAICIGLVLSTPLRIVGKYAHSLGEKAKDSRNHYSATIQEIFSKLRIIAGFGHQELALNKIQQGYDGLIKTSLRQQILSTLVVALYSPIGIIAAVSAFFVGRKLDVPVADIAVIIYAINRAYGTLSIIAGYKLSILTLCPSYEHLQSIMKNIDEYSIVFGKNEFEKINKEIWLTDVNFSYPHSDDGRDQKITLRGVSISIHPGKITALVGPSGSGKSTIADIVMGFQRPDSGTVSIDGVPLDEYEINSYRRKIGYVPQKNELFHATIRENLLWACPDALEDEIEKACLLSNSQEFIDQLPDGLDTLVGEHGAMLSGGQIQRLALARAVLRNPDILIMDEATSALDTESEKKILSSVEAISKKSATLIIAHRLSTIAKANRIYVLEDGEVIEQGSFDELMKMNGSFKRLVDMQKF